MRVLGGRVLFCSALLGALLSVCLELLLRSTAHHPTAWESALVARPFGRPTPPWGPRLPSSQAKRGSQTTEGPQ